MPRTVKPRVTSKKGSKISQTQDEVQQQEQSSSLCCAQLLEALIAATGIAQDNADLKDICQEDRTSPSQDTASLSQEVAQPLQEVVQSVRDSQYDQMMSQLREFIDKNALKNCAQRSAEWYKMRQYSFGGSEISNLMSICKKRYVTQQQFLCEKFMAQSGTGKGIDPKKQLIMDWGTFFEPMHRDVIQDIFKVEIYETSMCPAKGILQGSHQSPDGLTVVRTQDFLQHVSCHDIVDKSIFNKEYLTILIEQKCPYYRKPVKEVVPDHYIGQIKLGLNVFSICDVGCFSDSLIRVCTHRQWFNKAYNQGILKQVRQETPDPEPLYIGIVVFSQKTQQLLNLNIGDVSGEFTDAKFAQMMDLFRGGQLETEQHLFKVQPDIKTTVYDIVKRLTKEGKAFICWKLVGLTFTAVEKSKGFDSVLSIFISLGKKVLAKYAELQDIPTKEMQEIQEFSVFIKKLALPLTAGNHQDAWFRKNQQLIINKFEELFMDDWQSFYVLLSLMLGANDLSLKEKAVSYIERARDLCKEDPFKAALLETLISELQQELAI